jgi:hypothetical protein
VVDLECGQRDSPLSRKSQIRWGRGKRTIWDLNGSCWSKYIPKEVAIVVVAVATAII